MPTTILSFGGGQDSTAILHKLIEDAAFRQKYAPGELIVVMSATGDEHPETDAHVLKMRALCADRGIRFEFLSFDRGYHSGCYKNGLRAAFEANDAIGSVAFPATCSVNLKVEPIRRWIKEYCAIELGRPEMANDYRAVETYALLHGKIQILLGIAADEDRVQKPGKLKWVNAALENVYPLRDLGWNRAACQKYIASIGAVIPPPSNCMMCHYKSPQELLWTAAVYPAQFEIWVALERRKLVANAHMNAVPNAKTGKLENKNMGVKKELTLPQALAKAQRDFGHLSLAELDEYRMSHGHCTKSTF